MNKRAQRTIRSKGTTHRGGWRAAKRRSRRPHHPEGPRLEALRGLQRAWDGRVRKLEAKRRARRFT